MLCFGISKMLCIFVVLSKTSSNNQLKTKDMKTYKTTQKAHENRIVAELNAAVLTSTFPNKGGKQKADVYRKDSSPVGSIVAHGTCAPIGMKLEQTVMITF